MKKYWIDQSNGYPVMMTTNGKMPWRECFSESWRSCREAGPNYTMYLIFGIVAVGVVITLLLHSFLS
jgi:hypothetical protein